MRYLTKTSGVAAATAAACALGGSMSAAQAQPAGSTGLYAPSALVLSIEDGPTVTRAVTLSCMPSATGTHPAPESACAELSAVDGNFTQLVSSEPYVVCTKEWAPVTARVVGAWEGGRVDWTRTFANPCEMRSGLGGSSTFAF
ncbi:SSI family serine proteinase inhibitor [Streptomyces sp. KLOTTS4A1]|uniref:SSI family serine proteinase inhibitor n=1 Tax=Streptomyces sp. KLOTTS4A1 TaxID=3390996 RepID=UPI0039F4B70A